MSDNTITIELTPESQALIERFHGAPARLGARVARTVDLQNQLTIGYAQANKMSQRGPATLGVRTNRLRSSLRATAAVQEGALITSAIGTNVVYAAAHEFGFDGEVAVRAHSRKVSQAFGQPLKAAVSASVKAFSRHVHLPVRSFIRSSLGERAGAYSTSLSAAVVAATEGDTN